MTCSPFGAHNNTKLRRRERPVCAAIGCQRSVGRCDAIYCSQTCQHETDYRLAIEKWLSGEYVADTHVVPPFIHRYMREKFGECCSVCGWAERHSITGRIPVSLHHKDGDAANNRLENLELLCPNHHSLTVNYGSLNKGSARSHRRKSVR